VFPVVYMIILIGVARLAQNCMKICRSPLIMTLVIAKMKLIY